MKKTWILLSLLLFVATLADLPGFGVPEVQAGEDVTCYDCVWWRPNNIWTERARCCLSGQYDTLCDEYLEEGQVDPSLDNRTTCRVAYSLQGCWRGQGDEACKDSDNEPSGGAGGGGDEGGMSDGPDENPDDGCYYQSDGHCHPSCAFCTDGPGGSDEGPGDGGEDWMF